MIDPIEYLIYLPILFIAPLVIMIIVSLFRSCGILPLKLFDSYWKNQYDYLQKTYTEKSEQLANWKAEVYEKENIQELAREKRDLQEENSVLNAKVYVLQETNSTLTEALKGYPKVVK